jgi:hypothetical protein
MHDLQSLEHQREVLTRELAELEDMRQGSLVERYRKCGKPTCRCAKADAVGHGPSWSLTRAVKGQTRTTIIPVQAVGITRTQLQRAKMFRALCQQLLEVNEKICDAKLADPEAVATSAAKQKASQTRATRRVARRLRR